jgi:hypothetical protein
MLQHFRSWLRRLLTGGNVPEEEDWAGCLAASLTSSGLPAQAGASNYDGTRIDLLTPHHAVAVAWAPDWAEAVGKSLYYGARSRRLPVVLLLVSSSQDEHHVWRCREVCMANQPRITIWLFSPRSRCLRLADGQRVWVK